MVKRVNFSAQNLGLQEIAAHYDSLIAAMREYYSTASPSFTRRHLGYTEAEVRDELSMQIEEIDMASALSVISAMEAALRVDYLSRAYHRGKDKLSRALRDVYQNKAVKASLKDEIIPVWTTTGMMKRQLAENFKGVYEYRNWLVHGRYWIPKRGRKYDFFTVYGIAEQVFETIDQTCPRRREK